MVQCPRCGASTKPSSKFCGSCGAPLRPAEGSASPAPGAAAPPVAPVQVGQPWGAPPAAAAQPGPSPEFAAAQDQRFRVGAPEGLNPFGETMSPDEHARARGQNWNDPAAYAPTAPEGDPDKAQAGASAAVTGAPEVQAGASDAEALDQGPRTLAGFLVSYEDNDLGVFWPLHQGRNLIGRKDSAEGLNVEIDHPTTSSRHAIVFARARPGHLEIQDPGSTNGTFVNDARLEIGARTQLHDGDRVRFGGFVSIVKII